MFLKGTVSFTDQFFSNIFFHRGVNLLGHTLPNPMIWTISMCTDQSYRQQSKRVYCICAYYYGLMKKYTNTFNVIEIPIRQGSFLQGQGQAVCYIYESFLFQLSVTSW